MTRKHDAGFFSSAFSSLGGFLARRHRRAATGRPGSRTLRIEPCEARNLLAVISGTVQFDGGPPPAQGVTIELYRDDNGDGILDPPDATDPDELVGQTTTDPATGHYTLNFDKPPDGTYFVRQVVPPGFLQSGGPDYYAFDVEGPLLGSLVDDFEAPDPTVVFAIENPVPDDNPIGQDPTLVETRNEGILGGGRQGQPTGERDLLVDVLGRPLRFSAEVQVGQGALSVAMSNPGSEVTLQYDQLDDELGSRLSNTPFDVPLDLTAEGTNDGILFEFLGIDSGAARTELDLQIFAYGSEGTFSVFQGGVPDSVGASDHLVPFAGFNSGSGFSFADVTRLEIVFNSVGDPDVDFAVRTIMAQNPEGDGYDFVNSPGAPGIDVEKATNAVDPLNPTVEEDADDEPGPAVAAESTVTWTYLVTNPGDLPLAVTLTDDNGTPADDSDDFSPLFVGGDTNGDDLLDLDETWLYQASDTAAAGQYANLATVVGIAPNQDQVTDSDPSHYFGLAPGIDIEKTTNTFDADDPTGPIVPAGGVVTWQYVVTNTGNVPLSDVTVIDDNGTPGDTGDDFSPAFVGGDTDGDGLLDLDETWIYEAADVALAGQYANLATVAGLDPLDNPVTDADPSHYFGAVPGIDVEKATNGFDADDPTGPIVPAGGTVSWQYVVTNTGNVPLSDVTVTDDNGTPGDTGDDFSPAFVEGDTNGDGLLDLDETWLYQAAGTAIAGQYANLATVVGEYASRLEVTDADPSHYLGAAPGIDVEKAVNAADPTAPTDEEDADEQPGPAVAAGSGVGWTYLVSNTGNVPLDVTLTDDGGTPGDPTDNILPDYVEGDLNGDDLLDVDEVWLYAASGTAVAGQYANLATAVGHDDLGSEIADEDPCHYFGTQPAIDVEKATNGEDADGPTGPMVPVGGTVTWRYVVANPGNVPLAGVTVVDDNGTPGNTADDFSPGFIGGDNNDDGLLDTSETWLYSATGTAAAGQYANLATVYAVDPSDVEVTDDDPSHYLGAESGIHVEKATNGEDADEPTGPLVAVGSEVVWTYLVTNTGSVPLADVTLRDDAGTPGDAGDDFNPILVGGDTNGDGLLDVDETWLYRATGTAAAGQYANLATVTAVDPAQTEVTHADPSHYLAGQPGIHIEKHTNGQDADLPTGPIVPVGNAVTWTYTVTNTGNVPLDGVTVVEDNGTPADPGDDFHPILAEGDDNGDGLLDPDETWVYSLTGTAAIGQYGNVATVSGTDSTGRTVSDDDPSHHFGADHGIQIEKATNGQDADLPTGPEISVGDPVTWTYVVTNTGNVPLSEVEVRDDGGTPGDFTDDFSPAFLGGDANGDGILDLDETWLYEATGTARAGQYANVGEVTAQGPSMKGSRDSTVVLHLRETDPSHYLGRPLSSLSGNVYVDSDDNGFFDRDTEMPLPEASVALFGIDDLGDPVVAETTTDAEGAYLFADLRPGTYTIDETQPEAYLDGKDTVGTLGGTTSDDQFSGIDLPADAHGREYNFGELGLVPELASKRYLLWPWGSRRDEHDGSGDPRQIGSATVQGTSGDDLFEVTVSSPAGPWDITLNGEPYVVVPETGAVHFDGLAGNDTMLLTGTDGSDNLVLRPGQALMVGDTYAVTATNVENVTADGGEGQDTASFFDSEGDDSLVQWPTGSLLTGSNYSIKAQGFESVDAYATGGGLDVGKVYDSAGDDRFTATEGQTELSGDGFLKRAHGFFAVHAYATAGGNDTAELHDSGQDDQFVANSVGGALFNPAWFYNRAKHFEYVSAFADQGGVDVAKLIDSPGDDRFTAGPHHGELIGDGFRLQAHSFEGVHAYGTAGGHDVATLNDSGGDDTFVGTDQHCALFGPGYYNRAKHFEEVHANSSTGHDLARMADSAGDDHLEATYNWARLSWTGATSWVNRFDEVQIDSSNGGDDTKHVEAVDFVLHNHGHWRVV